MPITPREQGCNDLGDRLGRYGVLDGDRGAELARLPDIFARGAAADGTRLARQAISAASRFAIPPSAAAASRH